MKMAQVIIKEEEMNGFKRDFWQKCEHESTAVQLKTL